MPLLTREYLPAFASIADIHGLKEQVRTLNLLILLLPDVHQKVLKVCGKGLTVVESLVYTVLMLFLIASVGVV